MTDYTEADAAALVRAFERYQTVEAFEEAQEPCEANFIATTKAVFALDNAARALGFRRLRAIAANGQI